MSGGDGDDTLNGYGGADTLDGGPGKDIMNGGEGDDTYIVDHVGDAVNEPYAGAGIDTVQSSITFSISNVLENLTLLGTANINGSGNSLDNVIIGNSGDNRLKAGAGTDLLQGGAGDDTYFIDVLDTVLENSAGGLDTVAVGGTNVTYVMPANVENLVIAGRGYGNELDNLIRSTPSHRGTDDYFDGGLGADTMAGGAGNDTYVVDNIGDRVIDSSALSGTDTVFSSVTFTLDKGVENLTLTGTDAINGYGGDQFNTLIGNSASNLLDGGARNDVLDGGGGADFLYGGTGSDTYYVDDAADAIYEISSEVSSDTVIATVTFWLNQNVENLTLAGTADINGSGNDLNNIMIGNSGANRLKGGAGNDLLDGGAGGDSMDGGVGDDTYVVDDLGDSVNETRALGGIDLVRSSISFSINENVENLTLLGSGDIDGSGNSLDNIIIGNDGDNRLKGGAGNDRLEGGLGADIMFGGDGDDKYFVDNVGDAINETSAADGYDTVGSTISFALNDTIERLALFESAAAINGSGNALDNLIQGNSNDNRLKGGAGTDVLQGNGGADYLDGGTGADTLEGGSGDDYYLLSEAADLIIERSGEGTDTAEAGFSVTLRENIENLVLTGDAAIDGTGKADNNRITGNSAANVLTGGAGNDTLIGMDGDDTLHGGLGLDVLIGGFGSDVFVFDAPLKEANMDTIQSFSAADDMIHLDSAVFSALSAGELSASAFRADPASLEADDRIIYESTTGELFYDPDGSGSAFAELFAQLDPGTTITYQDFLVI